VFEEEFDSLGRFDAIQEDKHLISGGSVTYLFQSPGDSDVVSFLSISGDENPEGFLLDVGLFGFEATLEEGDELGMPDGLQTAEMRRSEQVGMLRDEFVDGFREDGAGIADELFEQFRLRFDGFGFELLEERGLSGREAGGDQTIGGDG